MQAIALAQPVRDMEAGYAAEHFDGGFEQDNGGRAVHVVVAVEQHRLAAGNGLLQPVRGGVHAQHELWIVELSGIRMEKREGFSRLGKAASHQQFGQHLGQMGVLGQCGGLGRMRLGQSPALTRQIPGCNL